MKNGAIREEIRAMNEKLSALEKMMERALTQPGSKSVWKAEGQHRRDNVCSDE